MTIPFLFGACSKKSTDVTPASTIQATWLVSAYNVDPAFDLTGSGTKTNDLLVLYKAYFGQTFVDCFKQIKITFEVGGKITPTTTSQCGSIADGLFGSTATWAITNDKITITDGTDVSVYDFSITGNTLKMSQLVKDDFDSDGKDDTANVILTMTKV